VAGYMPVWLCECDLVVLTQHDLMSSERQWCTSVLVVILYFTRGRVTDMTSRLRLWLASSNQLAVPPFNLSTVGKQAFPVSGANF